MTLVDAAHVLKARRSPSHIPYGAPLGSVCSCAGPDGQFAAGSLDSLAAVELANAVAAELGLQLPGTLVFDYPSVRAMAAFLHQQLAGPSAVPPRAAAPARLAGSMGQAGGARPSTRQLLRVCLCPDIDHGAGRTGFFGRRACPLDTQTWVHVHALRCAGTWRRINPSRLTAPLLFDIFSLSCRMCSCRWW